MPWPERIFHGRRPTVDRAHRKPGERVVREPIPPSYATEMMTVITALNDMDQPDLAWDCGTQGIGVVVSDSMMFQRGDPNPSDANLGSFYGLAMPLLKRGIPAEPVQLENAVIPGALAAHKVLIMTYEGMKPMTPEVHVALAAWVKNGGALVFLDDDADPYNGVRAWWNDPAKGMSYDAPRQHLFEQLGLPRNPAPGSHSVGNGTLLYDRSSPAALTHQADGDDSLRTLVRSACKAVGLGYRETNHLVLRRGPYVVAAGLDESLEGPPLILRGHFLNLFDAQLPTIDSVSLTPGSRHLLLDLDRASSAAPAVLASACKTLGAGSTPDGGFRFFAEGPEKIEAVVRVRLKNAPKVVTLEGHPLPADAQKWDAATRTVRLRFPNSAKGQWLILH